MEKKFKQVTMNHIILPESQFPNKAYDVQEYIKKLPQGKIDRIKRKIFIIFTELGLF